MRSLVHPAPRLSIIVPVLDEVQGITAHLEALQSLRRLGNEVIVVDGGSMDGTAEAARALADRVVVAARGRARQMNAGADLARGGVLVFLHGDTRLPEGACEAITRRMQASGRPWGRFDVRLSGRHPLLRLVEGMMNLRSRVTGIATGDQALFVERGLFHRLGGFPEISLMEDIALSRSLRRVTPPLCLRPPVVTSSRRWERRGVLRTILLMWFLRLAYVLGTDPRRLARWYLGGG